MEIYDFFDFMLKYIWIGWPLWFPVLLGLVAWQFWFFYIRFNYHRGLKWTLLYIKIPKAMSRSPLAMEMILNALYQTGGTGAWHQRWWDGKLRAYHSLEIVSIEGKIYFVIRTESRFANLIKSYVYSQYPQAEITEGDDYTKHVLPPHEKDSPYTGSNFKTIGAEFVLKKDDFLPIPTYIDYGLEKVTKDSKDLAIDPLAPMLEYMGSMSIGEQLWFQIIIRPDSNRYAKEGGLGLQQGWKDEYKSGFEKVAKVLLADPFDKEKMVARNAISETNKNALESIERNAQKFGFDTGVRLLYVHNNEKQRGDVPAFVSGLFRQFAAVNGNLNEFKMQNPNFGNDNPWDDSWNFLKGDPTIEKKRIKMFKKYVARAWFFHPYIEKPFILTTEELATIFHFPGEHIQTPSFERVQTKTFEPPANLPS